MQQLSIVLYWGAAWGIAEATVGHLLHIWAWPVGWMVWFPLAYGFMWAAYRRSGKPQVIWQTAVVASAIKLIDLLMPIRIDYVVNPAVSILFEGLALYALCKCSTAWRIPLSSILWRLGYCVYLFFVPKWMFEVSPLRGAGPLAQFLFIESAANSFLLFAAPLLARFARLPAVRGINPRLKWSFTVLVLAVLIQWRV